MNNLRKYGNPPYTVALIHGGPGAPGEMAPVAKVLSKNFGVLEPLQTYSTIEGQLQELHTILKKYRDIPFTLIGHSWGAWLSYIFAAKHPSLIKKLILISSGPFEEKYALDLMKVRLNRLTKEEQYKVQILEGLLNNPDLKNKNNIFVRFGELMSRTDSFDPLPSENDVIEFQSEIFDSVWKEAEELRKNGDLLKIGKKIRCPVIAIHGDYDPHPSEGVKNPLSQTIKSFRFILLEQCGHTPWLERAAKVRFYTILNEEID